MKICYSQEQIDELRRRVGNSMSPYRFEHTVGVEKMAKRIADIYCPEKASLLRVAALLHDITKELTFDEHIGIYRKYGIEPTEDELMSPATLHSVSAALVIPESYPEFADFDVVESVRNHTTGREGMSLCEKIIYLADYIDETRKYDDCIVLRQEFFSAELDKMSEDERMLHIDKVILHSFDLTIADLERRGKIICTSTIKARQSIISEIENYERK